MGVTTISWTDETWNPTRGCWPVSPGCALCYAAKVASRFSGSGMPYEGLAAHGKWTGAMRFVPEKLAEPLSWRKPRRVFVDSMSDLFHPGITFEQIAAVYGVMAATPHITYQILTKRPERRREFMGAWFGLESVDTTVAREGAHRAGIIWDARGSKPELYPPGAGDVSRRRAWPGWPLPNAWEGTSVENQETADARIPELLATPAAVRFLSVEPLLGPVDIRWAMTRIWPEMAAGFLERGAFSPGAEKLRPVDWVIVGGESGPGARPCDIAWIRSIVEQCRAAGGPAFVKQLGARPYWGEELSGDALMADGQPSVGTLLELRDRKGGDIEEFPLDLRVRMFPGEAWPAEASA